MIRLKHLVKGLALASLTLSGLAAAGTAHTQTFNFPPINIEVPSNIDFDIVNNFTPWAPLPVSQFVIANPNSWAWQQPNFGDGFPAIVPNNPSTSIFNNSDPRFAEDCNLTRAIAIDCSTLEPTGVTGNGSFIPGE